MSSILPSILGGFCFAWFTGQWQVTILIGVIAPFILFASLGSKGSRIAKAWRACKAWKTQNAPWLLNFDPKDPWEVYREVPIEDGSRDVRLLEIRPGAWQDPIECDLRTVDAKKSIPFDALSYSWTELFPGLDNDKSGLGLMQRINAALTQMLQPAASQDLMQRIDAALIQLLQPTAAQEPFQRQANVKFDSFQMHAFLSKEMLRLLEKLGVKTWIKLWGRVVGNPSKRLIFVSSVKPDQTKTRNLKFEVGINLEMALRHLRHEKRVVRLWADAVCINQDNTKDRNNQVQGMQSMYVKADSTEIWLGYARDITSTEVAGGLKADFRHRFAPTIPKDPRPLANEGERPQNDLDVTWEYRGEGTFGSGTPAEVKMQPEYQLLKASQAKWRKYHSLAISRRVFMYLPPTEQCLCMIHQLAHHAFRKCTEGQNSRPLTEHIVYLLKDSPSRAVFKVFEHLINARWWTRIWVVQETVFAKKIYVRYGGYRMAWELLVLAARNLEEHRQMNCCASDFEKLPPRHLEMFTQFSDQILSLETWRHAWRLKDESTGKDKQERKKIKLLTLIWRFRRRKTSDPRDKVYALYSLVKDFGKITTEQEKLRQLTLRYQSSVAAVYRHTFNNILDMEGNLNILIGNARKSAALVDDLPTWLPDWSEPPLYGEYDRLQRAEELYFASGDKEMDYDYRSLEGSHLKNILRVRGIILDHVASIGDRMPEGSDEASVAKAHAVHVQWRMLAGLVGGQDNLQHYRHLSFSIHKSNDKPEEDVLTKLDAYGRLLCMDTKKTNTHYDDELGDYVNPYSRVDRKYDRAMNAHCSLGRDDGRPPLKNAGTFIRRRRDLANLVLGVNGTQVEADLRQHDSGPVPELAKVGNQEKEKEDQEERSHEEECEDELAMNRKTDSIQHDFALQVNESEKSAIIGRSFFMTKNGYMGLGPDNIQEGDIVAIVFGCAVPLILRPVESQHVAEIFNDDDQHQLPQKVDQTNLEPRSTKGDASEQQCEAGAEASPTTSKPSTATFPPIDNTKLGPLLVNVPNSDSQDESTPALSELTECFKLVGDAYVQGAMYGEAVRDPHEQGVFLHLV